MICLTGKIVSSTVSSPKKNSNSDAGTILLVKHGKVIVDPKSKIKDAYVLEEDGITFSITLSAANITMNTNSYYLIQVIHSFSRCFYC